MRVKVNSLYRYSANGWDTFRPCKGNTLRLGDIVRVINLPSAPKANTMGQCYVGDLNGKFICMVSTNSLQSLTPNERKAVKRARTATKYRRPTNEFNYSYANENERKA